MDRRRLVMNMDLSCSVEAGLHLIFRSAICTTCRAREIRPLIFLFFYSNNFPIARCKKLVCTGIGSAKRWTQGCVNPASWLPLATGGMFTQPRAHLLPDPCTCVLQAKLLQPNSKNYVLVTEYMIFFITYTCILTYRTKCSRVVA